jgi:hypothetical protein
VTQKLTDLPQQELTGRVAKAIEVAQRRGFNGPWSLARLVILAMADVSREMLCCEAEIIEKSAPKLRQYSKIARKGWETRKRMAGAREASSASAEAERNRKDAA